MNLHSSVMVVGGGMFRMASTLLGSGETPSALTTWPRNLRLVQLNLHFSLLRVTPAVSMRSKLHVHARVPSECGHR